MKKILNIIFNNFYFCLFYIFTSLSFVTFIKNNPYIKLLPKIALVWGFIITIYNIYNIFKRKPNIIEIALFIFLISTLLLNIFVYRSNENLKTWFVDFIILASFLFINKEKTKNNLNKELLIISNFYVILTSLTSSLSLLLFFMHKSIKMIDTINGNDIIFGNHSGFFTNQNTFGISAAISFAILLFLFISTKNKKLKIFYSLIGIVQISSVIVSTSRSSILMFIALIFIFIFLKVRKTIFRLLLLLVPSIGLSCVFLLNENILYLLTSGRNELWTSALLVIKSKFLFGVGYSNLVQSVRLARDANSPGIDLGGLHNIYIQIFTTNGFIGILAFLTLISSCLYFIIKKVDSTTLKFTNKYYVLFSLICGILAINLFESNLMYIVSFISIIFWTYLGYTLSLIYNEEEV